MAFMLVFQLGALVGGGGGVSIPPSIPCLAPVEGLWGQDGAQGSWGLPSERPRLPADNLAGYAAVPVGGALSHHSGGTGWGGSHRALLFLPHRTPTDMFLPTQKTLENSLLPREPLGVREIWI